MTKIFDEETTKIIKKEFNILAKATNKYQAYKSLAIKYNCTVSTVQRYVISDKRYKVKKHKSNKVLCLTVGQASDIKLLREKDKYKYTYRKLSQMYDVAESTILRATKSNYFETHPKRRRDEE